MKCQDCGKTIDGWDATMYPLCTPCLGARESAETLPVNVTDDDIRTLRAESASAGDVDQVAICDRALGWLTRASELDPAAIDAAMEFSSDEAREACMSVIEDARAQSERS